MANKAAKKQVRPKSTSVALPNNEALSARQEKAIEDAVHFINQRVDNASSSIIEVGQYLLKQFFQDDIAKVHDRAPRKSLSLRKLAEHPDLMFSYSALSRAVALAVQEKQIATVAAPQQFTPTHKVLLLSVDGLEELNDKQKLEHKKKYLERIEKEKLSARRFQELLVKEGVIKPRGMAAIDDETERKLLRSGFHKMLGPIEAIVGLDLKKLSNLSRGDIQSAYQIVKKAHGHLAALMANIEAEIRK